MRSHRSIYLHRKKTMSVMCDYWSSPCVRWTFLPVPDAMCTSRHYHGACQTCNLISAKVGWTQHQFIFCCTVIWQSTALAESNIYTIDVDLDAKRMWIWELSKCYGVLLLFVTLAEPSGLCCMWSASQVGPLQITQAICGLWCCCVLFCLRCPASSSITGW